MKGLQAFCNLRKSSPGTSNKRLRQVKLTFLWFMTITFCFITLLFIFISIWTVLGNISNTLKILREINVVRHFKVSTYFRSQIKLFLNERECSLYMCWILINVIFWTPVKGLFSLSLKVRIPNQQKQKLFCWALFLPQKHYFRPFQKSVTKGIYRKDCLP